MKKTKLNCFYQYDIYLCTNFKIMTVKLFNQLFIFECMKYDQNMYILAKYQLRKMNF